MGDKVDDRISEAMYDYKNANLEMKKEVAKYIAGIINHGLFEGEEVELVLKEGK